MPNLKDFCRLYPDIYLMIGVSDRQVDLFKEGVACVIRTGELTYSTLVARPLGRFRWVTCAYPDYLKEHGVPETPEALSQHRAIHYSSGSGRRTNELHFTRGTETLFVPVAGNAAVNETGLYIRLCLEGFGLAQLAEDVVLEKLQQGAPVEVLADWQLPFVPVNMLYPHQCFLYPAVRAFADFVAGLFSDGVRGSGPSR